MLAAAHRLRRSADFVATIRRGRRAGSGAVVVHLKVLPEPARAPRAGLDVSRAVGSAPVRNRVKRQLRHLLRARIGALPEGAMLVVRALPAAADRGSAQLGTDLDSALADAVRKWQRQREPKGTR